MRNYLSILFFLFVSTVAWNQEFRIEQDEVKRSVVNSYIEKAEKSTNADSVYYYFNKAILIAKEVNYSRGEIRAVKGLVSFYENDEEIYEKLRYSLMLVGLYKKHGQKDELAESYFYLGKLYFEERLYSKSAENFELAAAEKIEDNSLYYNVNVWLLRVKRRTNEIDEAVLIATNLELKSDLLTLIQKIELQKEKAETYHILRAFDEELGSYKAIAALIKGSEYAYFEAANWNNIGYTHKYLKNFRRSKSAFYSAIRSKDVDNELSGSAYYNLGIIFQNTEEIDSSLICFDKAIGHFKRKKKKDTEMIAKCLNMKAMVYYTQDDQFNAQQNIIQAIKVAKSNKHPKVLSRAYEIESFIYQDLYEFELGLGSYKKHLSIRDSLLTEERSLENKLLFDQYKVEQIEKQLRLIWAQTEMDIVNLAREKAEKEAERERFKVKQREDQLLISALENKELQALRELEALLLKEERLKVENKEKELELIQRDNELKELALEKERLVVSENEKEIRLLAQKGELDKQRYLNEQQKFESKMQLVIGALLFLILIVIGVLIAYRQLRKRKKRIEAQAIIIAESKLEIEKEKEVSEGLLLNILPHAVAIELKDKGSSKPKLYKEVSVGFTDFQGFTMISEKLTPEELVHKLDEIFYGFDLIIERHGLQRIKTIGDAYMFASGLPEVMEDHAEKIVHAAIEMRDYINTHNRELVASQPAWNIRIGIHTGPVVAGVIGIKKFAYDIWGDTVNTAARMESSGQIAKVNISDTTYQIVKDKFKTEHRGKIAAKNKGEVDMYFVDTKS